MYSHGSSSDKGDSVMGDSFLYDDDYDTEIEDNVMNRIMNETGKHWALQGSTMPESFKKKTTKRVVRSINKVVTMKRKKEVPAIWVLPVDMMVWCTSNPSHVKKNQLIRINVIMVEDPGDHVITKVCVVKNYQRNDRGNFPCWFRSEQKHPFKLKVCKGLSRGSAKHWNSQRRSHNDVRWCRVHWSKVTFTNAHKDTFRFNDKGTARRTHCDHNGCTNV